MARQARLGDKVIALVSPLLQVTSGVAAVARIATPSYFASRGYSVLMQCSIAGDYAIKSWALPDAAYRAGLALALTVALRTLLIMAVPRLDQDRRSRVVVCMVFLTAQAGMVLWLDITGHAPLSIITLLPFCAMAFGAGTDISNIQQTRRWCILGLGCSQLLFAIATQAWGLFAKALITDIGASLYYLRGRSKA
jgi:hypothetical protein